MIGATVFYVAGFSALLPSESFGQMASAQVEAHKRNALQTVRLLLGIRAPRTHVAAAKSKPGADKSKPAAAKNKRVPAQPKLVPSRRKTTRSR